MATELYANVATTTVSAGGTTAPAGGTSESWTVASSTPFPAAATGVSQFHVADPAAPSELITVTNVSGTTWTVTRGAESTTPVTHAGGFTIWLVVTSGDLTAMLVNSNNLSDVSSATLARSNLGLGAAAVIGTPVSIANGGTGNSTQQSAMDALAGAVTSAQYLRGTGSHVQMSAIQSADVPTLNQNTSGTAANITGTLDTVPHPVAAVSMNSQKVTSLANGSSAQDGAAFGQIPLVDSTAAHILPDGVQAAGANGAWADSGHVHQNNADLTLLLAPSGATGETFPRGRATSVSSSLNSGTLYVCAIPLPKGLAVNNITLFTNTTVKTGGTHGWYVLLDNNRVVRAVTSDQTDPATVWGVASTPYTLSVAASAYTTTYAGLYYIGVMVAESAGTMPTFTTAPGTSTGIVAAAPILAGVSSVGQTTPPSLGTTMTTITFNGGYYLYAYTS